MTAALVAGLLAGYGIAMPVGAVATYLVALTARTSLRIGICAALGVATADGGYALAAVLGGAALARLIEPVAVPLRWLSALILVAVAIRGAATAISQWRSHHVHSGESIVDGPAQTMGPLRAYASLLGMTALNPITVVYFSALVVGSHGQVAATPWAATVFVAAAFVASASWQVLLAGGGALLGRVLTGVRGRLITALTSSTVIIACAAYLLIP